MLNLTGDISGCFHSLTPNIQVSFSFSFSLPPSLKKIIYTLLRKREGGEREILKEKDSLVTSNYYLLV